MWKDPSRSTPTNPIMTADGRQVPRQPPAKRTCNERPSKIGWKECVDAEMESGRVEDVGNGGEEKKRWRNQCRTETLVTKPTPACGEDRPRYVCVTSCDRTDHHLLFPGPIRQSSAKPRGALPSEWATPLRTREKTKYRNKGRKIQNQPQRPKREGKAQFLAPPRGGVVAICPAFAVFWWGSLRGELVIWTNMMPVVLILELG